MFLFLNDLDDTTKNKTPFFSIFYSHYRKDLKGKKKDSKGIRLLKQYVFKIYKLMKRTYSKDEQDV